MVTTCLLVSDTKHVKCSDGSQDLQFNRALAVPSTSLGTSTFNPGEWRVAQMGSTKSLGRSGGVMVNGAHSDSAFRFPDPYILSFESRVDPLIPCIYRVLKGAVTYFQGVSEPVLQL